MMNSGWPYSTGWPFSTRICLDRARRLVASISFMIFIASMMQIVSPSLTGCRLRRTGLAPGRGRAVEGADHRRLDDVEQVQIGAVEDKNLHGSLAQPDVEKTACSACGLSPENESRRILAANGRKSVFSLK
jgi:hypothetical protein